MAFIWVPSFFHPARTLSLSPHAGTHKELNSRARLTKNDQNINTLMHIPRALFGLDHLLLLLLFWFLLPYAGSVAVLQLLHTLSVRGLLIRWLVLEKVGFPRSGTSFDNGAIFEIHWIEDFTSLLDFLSHTLESCVNTFAKDAITGQNLACSRSGFLQVARFCVALPICFTISLGEKRISRRCYVVRRTVIARCSDRSKTLHSTNERSRRKETLCVK